MTNKPIQNLWFDETGERFFLIPVDAKLPDGTFPLQTLDGKQRRVNSYGVIHYEIKDEKAKKILHDHWRQGASEAAFRILEEAIRNGQLDTDRDLTNIIERIFNTPTSPKTIASNPDKYLDELYNLLQGLADLLEAETTPNRKSIQLAEHHLQALSDSGQDIGVDFSAHLDAILQRLGENTNPQRKQQLAEIVQILRESASTLADTPDAIDLDGFVRQMETRLNTAFGIHDDAEARQQAKEQEYREHADNAIAKSLSKFGFQVNKKS
jgi:hypothetical protein